MGIGTPRIRMPPTWLPDLRPPIRGAHLLSVIECGRREDNDGMSTSRHEETERKYDVSAGDVLPALADVVGVSEVGRAVDHELQADYFDTEALDLLRHGVSLRRRTGGDDEGWHLKVPAGPDTRTETRLPLEGNAAGEVPEELVEPVRVWVRDRALGRVARITTRRREYPLLSDAGVLLAQVTDDRVHAERLHGERRQAEPLHGGRTTEEWREWEVELAAASPGLLEAVESRLLGAGAARASAGSKLQRALGESLPALEQRVSDQAAADGSAGRLLVELLSQQTAQLHRRDQEVRAGRSGGIHKLRIAARRLRSALTTYRSLLAPGAGDAIRDELRWLGQTLAGARDAQVLRQHLEAVIAEQPPELVLGPVVDRIDDELRRAARSGDEDRQAALASPRYFRLLDALDALLDDPPLSADADRAADDVARGLVQRDAKRLRRAVRDVGATEPGGQARDVALHEARKKAKRLRYAAESAVPVLGSRAADYAARVKAIQQALGVHQDAVVAREALRDYGIRAHLAGANAFTFGLLHGLERRRADEAEQAFEQAWDDLPHKKVGAWLKG